MSGYTLSKTVLIQQTQVQFHNFSNAFFGAVNGMVSDGIHLQESMIPVSTPSVGRSLHGSRQEAGQNCSTSMDVRAAGSSESRLATSSTVRPYGPPKYPRTGTKRRRSRSTVSGGVSGATTRTGVSGATTRTAIQQEGSEVGHFVLLPGSCTDVATVCTEVATSASPSQQVRPYVSSIA